jgi:hypothetical protein
VGSFAAAAVVATNAVELHVLRCRWLLDFYAVGNFEVGMEISETLERQLAGSSVGC